MQEVIYQKLASSEYFINQRNMSEGKLQYFFISLSLAIKIVSMVKENKHSENVCQVK